MPFPPFNKEESNLAYSNVGIVNLALRRIGVARIASFTEDSPQAIDANACWEYIRDIVLEAKNWKFATLRYKLTQSTLTPEFGYDYAYGLPVDFLRLAYATKDEPSVYLENTAAEYPHVIETLSDGNLYLLTDYDNESYDIYIRAIRRVTDPQKYFPSFIDALAWRLAAELSTPLKEDQFKQCMQMYDFSLTRAEGVNQSFDFLEDETGSSSWIDAGR